MTASWSNAPLLCLLPKSADTVGEHDASWPSEAVGNPSLSHSDGLEGPSYNPTRRLLEQSLVLISNN